MNRTKEDRPLISVVSPVYRAPDFIKQLVEENVKALSAITDQFEIILVEDGSPDDSWKNIQSECINNQQVKGIKLSRNFGQNYAITAGLEIAQGEWVIVMDCDLQDQPKEIKVLYEKALEGFQIVFGERTQRKDPFIKKMLSRSYYKIMAFLTGQKQNSTISNFGIYHYKVIDAILQMKDQIRYFPIMSQWVGFTKTSVGIEHSERADGKTSYPLSKMLNMAVNNMIAFSDRPLKLIVQTGAFLTFSSIMGFAAILALHIADRLSDHRFYSLMLFLALLGGVILISVGIVGIYLGKTYDTVKGRPLYVIEEKLNA